MRFFINLPALVYVKFSSGRSGGLYIFLELVSGGDCTTVVSSVFPSWLHSGTVSSLQFSFFLEVLLGGVFGVLFENFLSLLN